jgi:hypothetical protein
MRLQSIMYIDSVVVVDFRNHTFKSILLLRNQLQYGPTIVAATW